LKIFKIPAENSVIPGNSCGNCWDGGFPGIPEWEFLVALLTVQLSNYIKLLDHPTISPIHL